MIQVLLTSLLSAAVLFVLTKIMGHKQVAQLDFFDYVNGITIGSIAAELATDPEEPWRPLIAMIVYGAVALALSLIANHFPRSRKFINGTPTILMNGGKLYRANLKKAKLDLSEFLMMCRQEGYFDLSQIQTAVLEYNGRLTILPRSADRPATPSDLGISVPEDGICTEVIMDGRILSENLKRQGLDLRWLEKRLDEQGFHSAKEVFLGICDKEKQLVVYKGE